MPIRHRHRLHASLIATALCCALAVPAAVADDTPPASPDTAAQLDAGLTAPATIAPPPVPPVTVTPDGDIAATPGGAVDKATSDPMGTIGEVVRDIRDGGPYRYAAAGILVLLMALGIRLRWRIFGRSRRGKAIAVLVFSILGAASTGALSPVPISAELFLGALGVAWTAVGGRSWLKSFLWPDDGGQWLTWLQPVFGAKPGGGTS